MAVFERNEGAQAGGLPTIAAQRAIQYRTILTYKFLRSFRKTIVGLQIVLFPELAGFYFRVWQIFTSGFGRFLLPDLAGFISVFG